MSAQRGVADTEVLGNREIDPDPMLSPRGGGLRPQNQSDGKFCETYKSDETSERGGVEGLGTKSVGNLMKRLDPRFSPRGWSPDESCGKSFET